MPSTDPAPAPLSRTALHALHLELGAKMVPFAGYDMPVQYPGGIIKEHLHCRAQAGLFDVSHMGQAWIEGAGAAAAPFVRSTPSRDAADSVKGAAAAAPFVRSTPSRDAADSVKGAAAALEALVPGDIAALAPGRMRYTMFTDEAGGILDDVMVTAREDGFLVVLNAARKAADMAHLRARLAGAAARLMDDRALLALQGPAAATVMARLAPDAAALAFMSGAEMTVAGVACFVTRSGYTGEDGFEISLANARAEALARRLLAEPEVAPIGLGARDTLRLEAGLCLYGHDIDTTTSPVEAGLAWTISKRRRAEGGFPGADRIARELAEGPLRKRVGIRPEGRQPAREGASILDAAGKPVGALTSGGFSPTLGAPIAMGYVAAAIAKPDTQVSLDVRGKALPARIVPLPFVPHRYRKG